MGNSLAAGPPASRPLQGTRGTGRTLVTWTAGGPLRGGPGACETRHPPCARRVCLISSRDPARRRTSRNVAGRKATETEGFRSGVIQEEEEGGVPNLTPCDGAGGRLRRRGRNRRRAYRRGGTAPAARPHRGAGLATRTCSSSRRLDSAPKTTWLPPRSFPHSQPACAGSSGLEEHRPPRRRQRRRPDLPCSAKVRRRGRWKGVPPS